MKQYFSLKRTSMYITKKTYIDVPSGWKYGFPKIIPADVLKEHRQLEWIVEQGYPQEEIDKCGKYFAARYWTEGT